jgi:Na+/proline symporter
LESWLIVWRTRYQHEVQTSEMFSTAGRTVKSGLVASAVVSSWTWAATLLQSSGVAYQYGVSGPFYYAAGNYSGEIEAPSTETKETDS